MDTGTTLYFIFATILIVFGSILFFFYHKRRKLYPIRARSTTISIYIFFEMMICVIVYMFHSTETSQFGCFMQVQILMVVENFLLILYITHASRILFIAKVNQEKLMNAKRLYVQLANTSQSSVSEQDTSTVNDSSSLSSVENSGNYLDSLNIDVKLADVEKNFYRERALHSEKIQIITLLSVYAFLITTSCLIFFFDHIWNRNTCRLDSPILLALTSVFGVITFIIMTVKCIQIRKINDAYKIKNEIYRFYFLTILINIVGSSLLSNDLRQFQYKHYVLLATYCIYLIAFGYPLFLSYQKKFSIESLEKDCNNKDKNSFQKFMEIIDHPEKVKYFIDFTKSDFSVENILFYRAVKAYQHSKHKLQRRRLGKRIVNNFVQTESKLELNLENSVRTKTLEAASNKKAQRDCFDVALKSIVELMYTNSYPSFLQSNLFAEMVINTDNMDKGYILEYEKGDEDKVDKKNIDEKDILLQELKNEAKSDHKSDSDPRNPNSSDSGEEKKESTDNSSNSSSEEDKKTRTSHSNSQSSNTSDSRDD
ncbi:regulator of g protein signaling [Anaeramoeba flamelloides]|uniref:Regulator of g protein signaling n=1 Tax=Anaeramoeba flamelloides TaxID=1746091 RepID=A0ABQ8Y8E2_9EUKA|nr:regulator of g protein signaling [Anaeramoeba flamelloides]